MKREELAERIGNIDDRLICEAGELQIRKDKGGKNMVKKLLAMAAVAVLMVCSGAVGAVAFSQETVIEVPAEQELAVLEEIGLTLIFPDSWRGRYEVIEDTFEPYNSPMWEICVKSVYEAKVPADESGEILYRGTLFYVFQCSDYSMSAEEFEEESGIAGIGRYLFATENATYAIMYTTDVQFDPTDPAQSEEFNFMEQTLSEIKIAASGLMG